MVGEAKKGPSNLAGDHNIIITTQKKQHLFQAETKKLKNKKQEEEEEEEEQEKEKKWRLAKFPWQTECHIAKNPEVGPSPKLREIYISFLNESHHQQQQKKKKKKKKR